MSIRLETHPGQARTQTLIDSAFHGAITGDRVRSMMSAIGVALLPHYDLAWPRMMFLKMLDVVAESWSAR